jgi:cysteine desulfurase/selenocysteine lyase
MTHRPFDLEAIRAQFPILGRQVHGKPLIYLDSAASSQKPESVISAQADYLRTRHANVHRGVHTLSQEATDAFEAARERIRQHLHAAHVEEVIFTSGATASINLVAAAWGRTQLRAGDVVVVTRMDHHANIVPWQMVAERTGARVMPIAVLEDGTVDEEELQRCLALQPKLVAFPHVSNVLGTVNPVARWVRAAHDVGAVVLVDGCQAVPHLPVDVQALGADFYAFSAHKAYGPTGFGVLYGKRALLEAMPPFLGGGEMIAHVDFEEGTTFAELPFKFEAGTPHISGAIACAAALDWMSSWGLEALAAHEHQLVERALAGLSTVAGIRLVGTPPERVGVVSFLLEGVHPYDVGVLLDAQGVAVRTGMHCAEPLMKHLGLPGTVRASFAAYNTPEEVDAFVAAVHRAARILR